MELLYYTEGILCDVKQRYAASWWSGRTAGRRCDAIADVDCAVGSAPCLTAADDSGYEIDEAEVAYWGRCPDCVAQSQATSQVDPSAGRRRSQARNAATESQTPPSTGRDKQDPD